MKAENDFVILLIEDNPGDFRLFKETVDQINLNSSGSDFYTLVHQKTLKEGVAYLQSPEGLFVNVVALDLWLPDSGGLETVASFRKKNPFTPLVVFTSASDEDVALTAINQGAQDILVKGDYNAFSVKRSLKHAIHKATLVNEIHKKNKELEDLNCRLDKASKAKSSFLASMSHEIRTPLNSILGMAQILKENVKRKENLQYLDIIMRAGDNLLELINDVLDLSKIEAGEVQIENTPFNLEEVVEKSIEMMGVKASEKDLDLILNLKELPSRLVIGDGGRVQQILLNLLSNAIKFTEKGEIVLRVEKCEKSLSPSHILFSVLDTGMGISKSKQDLVFENFTQADASITRRFGGTGLGLSISRNLARLMGGDLVLSSEEGKGSIFSFDIPFHTDSSLSLSKVNKKRSFEGKKALVIEKNKTQIHALKEMLEEVSMGMEAFSSTEEGMAFLDKSEHSKIDVILLDSRFLDGKLKENAKNFEKYKGLSKKLIVMLSSNYKPENLKMIRYFGAKRYLIKPILKSYLRHSINNLLNVKPLHEKEKAQEQELLNEKPLKLLYAEDCEANRMLFKLFLKKTKHTLDFAENGEEAVVKVLKGNYDIVFLDVQMPVKDGLTATQEIRAWEERTNREPLPIYSLTAHALKEDIQKSIDAGCNGHITKPVKKDLLLKQIRKYSTNF